MLITSPLISISEPNGFPISGHQAAQIQNVIALGITSLWVGIARIGAICGWRLAWIVLQNLPRNPSGATKNGMAQV